MAMKKITISRRAAANAAGLARLCVFTALAAFLFPAAPAHALELVSAPAIAKNAPVPAPGAPSVEEQTADALTSVADKARKAEVYFDFNPDSLNTADAVVMSACGMDPGELGVGPFQYSMVREAMRYLFPEKDAGDEKRWRQALAKINEYQAQFPESSARRKSDSPDTYLEDALRRGLAGSGKRYLIVPLRWSRDIQNAGDAPLDFKVWVKRVYAAVSDRAAADNRRIPVYMVGHSWGTVLLHATLQHLKEEGSDVKVDEFVTLGSPLTPGSWWLNTLMTLGIIKDNLPWTVSKPGNADRWVNVWASRDMLSNAIAAADSNVRVDKIADFYSARLDKIMETSRYARSDKAALDAPVPWHSSYAEGFRLELKSLHEKLDKDIFAEFIRPAAFAR
ncbi:MAG: hypothetical protein PHP45_04310 [Elusimicrobiales bacterium]|nr:hypothetical protein [Elusimicrobiales bacterium]